MILVPTVLSGGSGSRLWPVSRMAHPKPFIRLRNEPSFLQKAYLRALALPDTAEVLTVTNRDLFFQTEEELREVNTQRRPAHFILEPFGRNTAAAICAAALDVRQRHGGDAVMLVLSSDHAVSDPTAFTRAAIEAAKFAQDGKLVTFGIKPDAPETGYGYIHAKGNDVIALVEKPDLARAKEFLKAGYLWNAGIFCFTAGTFLAEMKTHAPALLESVETVIKKSRALQDKGLSWLEIDADSFTYVQNISIDYALLEHSKKLAVVPCDIGWSDVGSWRAMSALYTADAKDNRVIGDAVLHNTRNCFIRSEDRVIGAAGVEDLIIVDTEDALLVAHRDRSQDVGQLFSELKSRGHDAHKCHKTAKHPWGTATVLQQSTAFFVRRLNIKPGVSLALHEPQNGTAHWVVAAGSGSLTDAGKTTALDTGAFLPCVAGKQYTLYNNGKETLTIIETQTENAQRDTTQAEVA